MRKALLGMVLASTMALVSSPAFATATAIVSTTSLPSSDDVISRHWLKMNPSTFTASNAAVLEQYDRAANLDARLTSEKRARLAAMLLAGQGIVVMVPDGIGLDYLTGRFEGSPFVYVSMQKKLGRSDRALIYDLGDGVTLYWFTGQKNMSCNNIGIVINRPPPAPGVPPPPPQPKKQVCQIVYTQRQSQPTAGQFIPSLYLVNCCCEVFYTPSLYLSGNSSDTMTIAYQVCS